MTTKTIAGPAWASNLPVYEVNLDVYGFPRGSAFREYEQHLPVLKELGAGLIWFMPLAARGETRAFGSPYAVRDYCALHAGFGTKAEFKHLVARAHALGLRVIVDWVPNHTAWDHAWLKTNPQFYRRDATGAVLQAGSWFDTAQLDFGRRGRWNMALWQQMRDAMLYWLRAFDIDGFRCDTAGRGGHVPVEFWRWLRPQLDACKPVFMLAEADDAWLHPAFDMTYSWNLPPRVWDICAGRAPAIVLDDVLRKEAAEYPAGAIRMRFLDNHDWHPNADWCWGDKPPLDTSQGMPQVAPLMVLCTTLPGKPLLYNGQELSFCKTDPPRKAAVPAHAPVWHFYQRLLTLYQTQPAVFAGSFTKLPTSGDEHVYAFMRQRGLERVIVAVNLSAQTVTATVQNTSCAGRYHDWFADRAAVLTPRPAWHLEPWAYRVYVPARDAR